MYRIRWQSLITGFESAGDPIFATESECRHQCDLLNTKYRGKLHHWPEFIPDTREERGS